MSLCALTLTAYAQIAHWRDTDALFSHAIRVDPNNWLAWPGRLSAGSAVHPRPEIVLSSIPAGLWFRSPIRGASASSAIAFSEPRGR